MSVSDGGCDASDCHSFIAGIVDSQNWHVRQTICLCTAIDNLPFLMGSQSNVQMATAELFQISLKCSSKLPHGWIARQPDTLSLSPNQYGQQKRVRMLWLRILQVRNTVDTGRTVVCTIHQPSIDIFEVGHPTLALGTFTAP